MSAFAGVRRWFHLDRPVEQEIDEELAFHFERAMDDLLAKGFSREDANTEAKRRFGDLSDYRNQLRDIDNDRRSEQRRSQHMANISRNVRMALRAVRRNPGFAAVIALMLGLGIGINASMFGLLDRLLFTQPALVREPDQVRKVYVTRSPEGRWIYGAHMTYPDVLDLKAAKHLSHVVAFAETQLALGTGDSRQMIPSAVVETPYFELLGVRPLIGRFLVPSDDSSGALTGNAVISYGFWQRQFGGATDALGKTLELGSGRYTVVGVAPEGFSGIRTTRTDVWLPLRPAHREMVDGPWETSRGFFWLQAVVRVKPDASIEQAEAEATSLHLAGRSGTPNYAEKQRARITFGPLLTARGPASQEAERVSIWAGGVSLAVLLVACANVANFLLFRAIRRRREIAVRLALGVSRGQLVAELLTESLVLAMLGGLGALVITFFASGLLHSLLAPDLASTLPALSWRIAGFTVLASISAGLLAGLVPAWLESRPDLLSALKETAGKGGHTYIRSGLVILQTALSVTLLVGAGLFVVSLARLRAVDIGVDVERVLVVSPDFPKATTDAEIQNFFRDASERLASLPGVEQVATTAVVPYNWSMVDALTVPGFDSLPIPKNGGPYFDGVSNTYFETMGMRIVAGRGFGPEDVPGNALTIVIGEAMAQMLWPGQSALGRCMKFGGDTAPCREIVGVVHDTQRDMGMIERGDKRMQYYLPLAQLTENQIPRTIMIRSTTPLALAGPVRAMLMQINPRLLYVETRSFEQLYNPDFQQWKMGAGLFTAFGALALIVSAIGLYSLLAYGVAQRTREIGVRIALGARSAKVVGLVLREGVLLVAAGVTIGLALAVVGAHAAATMLFQTTPTEPVVYIAVAAVLLAIAVAAGALPAWRATRVSPMTALRAE